ncbi:hypothetical protein [Oleiharenicola sp. Vm1]|uniref:hypothetical protein n=1 Tax=Oleiharenicola sp. Vm1 TaxID=3398393 RepID=UPI0039F53C65
MTPKKLPAWLKDGMMPDIAPGTAREHERLREEIGVLMSRAPSAVLGFGAIDTLRRWFPQAMAQRAKTQFDDRLAPLGTSALVSAAKDHQTAAAAFRQSFGQDNTVWAHWLGSQGKILSAFDRGFERPSAEVQEACEKWIGTWASGELKSKALTHPVIEATVASRVLAGAFGAHAADVLTPQILGRGVMHNEWWGEVNPIGAGASLMEAGTPETWAALKPGEWFRWSLGRVEDWAADAQSITDSYKVWGQQEAGVVQLLSAEGMSTDSGTKIAQALHRMADQEGKPFGAPELMAETGLAFRTVWESLDALENRGVLQPATPPEQKRNRTFKLAPDWAEYGRIGVMEPSLSVRMALGGADASKQQPMPPLFQQSRGAGPRRR